MNKFKIYIIILLIFGLWFFVENLSLAKPENPTLSYILQFQESNGSIQDDQMLSDWAAIAISANDFDLNEINEFNKSLYDYLNESILIIESVTDIERRILALAAADIDPRDMDIDLVNELYKYYNQNQIGETYLVNDDIFGMLALIAAGESQDNEILQNTKNFVLNNQKSDGSFSYHIMGNGDVDDTAAAIEALIIFKTELEVQNALNLARSYLLESQNNDGGFGFNKNDSESNLGSTSWAIRAIYTLGENPQDWIKNAKNPMDYLHSCKNSNGSFNYQPGLDEDLLMTIYAFLALSEVNLPTRIVADYCDKKILPPKEPMIPESLF
ncbi:MAG: prenyltransferase/squalene oxidase repeat-containing protein [Promethearchaeota archaeon]